jgi:flavin-dependent dehydrogenase
MRGMVKIPNLLRPAAGRGVALVGDSALSLDPIWGVGCAFAFLAAEWLCEITGPALEKKSPRALDQALVRYRKAHRARFRGHEWHISGFSKVRDAFAVEEMLFSAAVRDRRLARAVLEYVGRNIGLLDLMSPANVLRAAWINLFRSSKGEPAAGAAQRNRESA